MLLSVATRATSRFGLKYQLGAIDVTTSPPRKPALCSVYTPVRTPNVVSDRAGVNAASASAITPKTTPDRMANLPFIATSLGAVTLALRAFDLALDPLRSVDRGLSLRLRVVVVALVEGLLHLVERVVDASGVRLQAGQIGLRSLAFRCRRDGRLGAPDLFTGLRHQRLGLGFRFFLAGDRFIAGAIGRRLRVKGKLARHGVRAERGPALLLGVELDLELGLGILRGRP